MSEALEIGGKYNWAASPERLIYLGKQGSWHQFALVESPESVWCEVLPSDMQMLERTQEQSE